MSKQLANVTKNPQRIARQIHRKRKPQPESSVIIVEPNTLQIKEQCPAWGKSCRICGVRNHFANVCRKAQKTDLHAMNELDSENTDDDGDYVEYVTSVTLVHDEIHQVSATNISPFATEIYAELIVKDEPVKFQLDCGATINIIIT